MSFVDLTLEELNRATKREDLMRETARQIMKDFTEFGFEILFPEGTTQFYDELLAQMNGCVIALLENSQAKFLNILCRLNVLPEDIQKCEEERPQANWSELTAELIIYRELKKVMIRDYFRSH